MRFFLLVVLALLVGCAAKPPPGPVIVTPEESVVTGSRQQPVPLLPPVISTGESVVRKAANLIGRPYAWGGADPGTGFDCSGLVVWVYGWHGVELPRTAREQSRVGKRIPFGKLQPGDLVFFRTSGRTTNHVGIATGRGTFIHSPKPGEQVREESLRHPYWRQRLIDVRRITDQADLSMSFSLE